MQTWDTRLLRMTVASVLAGVTIGLVGGAFRWCLAQAKLHRDAMKELLERALTTLPEVSVLVLSDHDKGVLSDRVCRTLVGEARRLRVPVVVDPKGNDFSRYRGATAICPNAKELAAATGESAGDLKRLLAD